MGLVVIGKLEMKYHVFILTVSFFCLNSMVEWSRLGETMHDEEEGRCLRT